MQDATNTIEYGHVDFSGQTEKNITLLHPTFGRGQLQLTITELPDTYATGSNVNIVTDIPNNYYGTIQVAGKFITDSQITIYTTSPFYGRVHWVVSSN